MKKRLTQPNVVMAKDKSLYLVEPLEALSTFIEETSNILQLSIVAIKHLDGHAELIETFQEVRRRIGNPEPLDIAGAAKLERAAQEEIRNGFQLLIAHSVVALWAALECTIPQVCAAMIYNNPEILKEEKFEKIKLPIQLITSRRSFDLFANIIEELERNLSAKLKIGVGRFESVLDQIGLGGEIDDRTRRDLLELSQLRNLIVHRFGKVDKQFKIRCKWINVKVGARIKLNIDDYFRYQLAVANYSSIIAKRILNYYDKTRK